VTAPPQLLSAALERFAQDPVRSGKVLRQALDTDKEAFLRTITSYSAFDVNDRGFRYALILLRNSDLLISTIATPSATSAEQALGLTKCMLALDPNFLNSLLDAIFVRPALRDTACILRILDLIGQYAERISNWRPITRLFETGDARVKSKCATLLVRFRFDQNTTAARFEEGDSRVRASIVEALSDRSSERNEAMSSSLLETALKDNNNRVAGNACLALYQAGDARALTCLSAMLSRQALPFRTTAAWAMGQTRDIRFLQLLARASRSALSDLRAAALKSQQSLDPIPSIPAADVPQPVSISALVEVDHTELWVRAVDRNGRFVRDLRSLDFFMFSGDIPLLEYSVENRCSSANTSVAIVYPLGDEGLVASIIAALRRKPLAQRWAFSAYGQNIGQPQQVQTPAYEADSSRLAATFSAGTPGTLSAGRSCRSILRLNDESEERHLVVILDGPGAADLDFQKIRTQCRERRMSWHCVRTQGFGGDAGITRQVPVLPSSGAGVWWTEFTASLQESYVFRTPALKGPAEPTSNLCLDLFLRDTSGSPARFSKPAKLLGHSEIGRRETDYQQIGYREVRSAEVGCPEEAR
jgi:hypothetical protein